MRNVWHAPKWFRWLPHEICIPVVVIVIDVAVVAIAVAVPWAASQEIDEQLDKYGNKMFETCFTWLHLAVNELVNENLNINILSICVCECVFWE